MIKKYEHDQWATRINCTDVKITDLSKLIGQKWFLPLEKLAKEADVPLGSIKLAVKGEQIHPHNERKLRKFLENYKGCQTYD